MLRFENALTHRACARSVKRLYRRAFPRSERVPLAFLNLKARQGAGESFGVYDGEEFVGLCYNIPGDGLVYLFYLAVEESGRGKGWGTQILSQVKEMYPGKRILLSIEEIDPAAPNYEERVRRKRFYERSGFADAHVKFRERGEVYEMLCFGGAVTGEEYAALIRQFVGPLFYRQFYERIET